MCCLSTNARARTRLFEKIVYESKLLPVTSQGISYRVYDGLEISTKRIDLMDFLLKLGHERETLFSSSISEEDYPEICEQAIDRILNLIIATDNDKIVGVSTFSKYGNGILFKISPFIHGWTVVKADYQGKGIGSKLEELQSNYHKNKWHIWDSVMRLGNQGILKVVKKNGYIVVGKDDQFHYAFYPTNTVLKIFTPIIYVFYRLYKIEYKMIKKTIKRFLHTSK
jgi:hypothetical protein